MKGGGRAIEEMNDEATYKLINEFRMYVIMRERDCRQLLMRSISFILLCKVFIYF